MDRLKKSFVYLYKIRNKVLNKFKLWEILLNKDIHIDLSTFIHPTAIIEIIHGGSITIESNGRIGEGVIIQTYGGNIKIGKNCNINPNTIIYGHGDTIIGDDVLIAGGCMVIPSNHNYNDDKVLIRSQGETSKKITIENDVWIAHGCSILNGVTIGKGSIIAAGAVVNNDVKPFSINGGIPAKEIKKRF